MKITLSLILIFFILVGVAVFSQQIYLKIDIKTNKKYLKQGEEGFLKIKITPIDSLKISSHPEFIIKFNKNLYITFPKVFFTATELNFQTVQEENGIFIDLNKEITIPFKLNENAPIGKHTITGDIVFTAVNKVDNWSLKTLQKFSVSFNSRRNYRLSKAR